MNSNELASRIEGRIIVRGEPLRVRFSIDSVLSEDHHAVQATFTASVRARPEPAETHLLAETFLASSDAVTSDAVVRHFSSALKSAAMKTAAVAEGPALLSDGSRESWITSLRTAADSVAFSCGLELLPPFDLELASPTLEKERLEQMQRTLAERQTAGRIEHLARASELLKQWEHLRASSPQTSAGHVLEQLSPSDQGSMLQTLLLAVAGKAVSHNLWAVSGPYLVRVEVPTTPNASMTQPPLISLPTDLGPLRSVRIDHGQLLIGARNGVFVSTTTNPADVHAYVDPDLSSEHGFSRAVLWNNNIWAAHRDGGLVCWNPNNRSRPEISFRPSELNGGVKHVIMLDDQRLLFTAGSFLYVIAPNAQPRRMIEAASAPLGVFADDSFVLIASEDGTVMLLDRVSLDRVRADRRSGTITSAALLPWLSSHRLLLATDDGPICCAGIEDPLVTQYISPHAGLRALAASTACVAGLSADRQRIILWNSWDGRKPSGELHITALTRHRAADIAFG